MIRIVKGGKEEAEQERTPPQMQQYAAEWARTASLGETTPWRVRVARFLGVAGARDER